MKTPRFVIAACALLLLGVFASAAQAQGGRIFGKDAPFALEELPAGKLKSQLQALDPQARGKAMQWLHSFSFGEFDAAHHLRADAKGGIFYICADHQGRCDGHQHGPVKPGAAPISDESSTPTTGEAPADQGATTPEVAGAAVPISSPPAYNSKPGATRHIYIDFNGAYVTGKAWSETDGVTTWTTWDCYAWSSDADKTTFSDAEQADIRRIWERLAEDYAPFDVNVTTDVTYDPDTYTGDKNKVGWLVVTPTTDKAGARCPHYGAGGVAYVGVYGNANYFSTYQPAWVTPMGVANTAEAASHEMGHNMGLSHDGLVAPATPAEYYGGHAGTTAAPSWGPIMGTGYGRNVSQWSKGEYYGGSQLQDDLSILNGRTPYRVDDHGGTFGTATVWLNASINQPGIIERTNDNDVFTFTTGAGNISFSANPYKCSTETWGGNSDIVMELYNSSQVLVASSNPASDVTASIAYTATAGDYYLVIKPTGCGTPTVASPNGYTVYGSLGQYTVTGTIIPANGIVLTSPNGGEKWVRGSNADVTWASGLGGNVKIELLKAGALFTTLAASTPNDGSFTWAVPTDYTVGSNYRIRITSVEQPTKIDESLADFSITVPPPYYASMNTNPGWTFSHASWAYGVPTGANQDGYGNPDPTAGQNGTSVIGYNLAGDYEASITATRWATTPAINCSTYTACKLSFYRWLGVEGGYDNAYIQVSNDNTNWTQVWRSSTTNGVNDQDSGWTYCEYDISAVADGKSTVYVRWGMGTTDSSWQWCGWNLDEVKVDGTYTGPTVGVVVTQSGGSTNVTEGGATDTYTVKLNSAPSASVTVSMVPNSQVSVSPTSLTFTTGNWGTAQTVTVTAVNDGLNEFSHTGSIAHTVASTDPSYQGLPTEGVVVNITDNDNIAPAVNAGTDQSVNLIGGAWTPLDASPIVWYDASDAASITANAGAVSQWADKIGTRHMLQATAAKQPITGTAQINGLNAISFDGTDDALKTALNPFGSTISNAMMIGVFNIGTLTNSTLFSLTGSATTANRWQSHCPYSDGKMYYDTGGSGSTNRVIATPGWVAGENKILGFYSSLTDNVQQVWANGTSLISDATGHSVATVGGMSLAHDGSSSYDNCTMGEVLAINNTVNAATREKLEGYLAHKWGLTGSLPAAHPYKTLPPTSASATANLDGTVSDANGDSLTTSWTVVSGPGPVAFGNTAAVDTTATFSVAGTYTLRLSASDPAATTNDDVIITVNTGTSYTVTYSGNNHTGGVAPSSQNKLPGVNLTLATNSGNLTRIGYTFAGWNTNAAGSGTDHAVGATYATDANLALYAKWIPNTYPVTYNANGATSGTAPASQTKTHDVNLTLQTNSGVLARTGYNFGGWNTAADGTGTTYAAGATYTGNAPLTLYAKWNIITYNVTYNINGATSGTAPANQVKTWGVNLTLQSNTGLLAKTGYTFSGWNTLANGTGTNYAEGALYTANAGVTLYAKWIINTYPVTYSANGATSGTAPANQTKTYGVALTLQTNSGNLARTGYIFSGWNTAADGTGTDYAAGASYTTEAALALHAKWVPAASYAVTYNANGATSGTAPADQTKIQDVALTLQTNSGNLAKTGFVFVGWNTAADGTGVDYAVGASYTTNAALALYAKWTSAATYAVTYDGNGASSGTVPASQTKVQDVALTLQTNSGSLAKTGYTFVGWNTNAAGTGIDYPAGGTYVANAAVTLYAKWTLETYTVSYNGNGNTGGTAPANQTKTYNVALTLATNSGALVRTGYTFAGWNTAANGTGTPYAVSASYTVNAAATLYAQWTPNTYTVTYNANSATSGTVPANQTKTQDVTLVLATNSGNLARTGYTFAGWNTAANGTGTSYAVGANYTANAAVTLYAKWTPNTYVVSYNANGATSGTAPANQTKTHDVSLTLALNSGALTKTAFVFSGWNTAADGTGTNYAEGAAYTANAAVTLYAKWTAAPTYTVTYNGNGNSGGAAPANQTKTQGVTLVLATNSGGLVKTGYTFVGWNTNAAGTGTDYAAGGNYTADVAVTLYAKWTINTYTVSYNANGATSGTAPADQTKTHDVALTLATNSGSLARTGYTFAGWNTAANGGGTDFATGASYTTNAAVTLYAKWTPDTYVVSYSGNGSTGGTAPANQTKVHDIALTLATNSGSLVRTGYTFAGWNTAADGSGTSYAAGASYTGNAALALYANWTPDTYVVSYSANGATSGTAPANQTKVQDVKLTLSTNVGNLARTGHTFAGWNTSADGTGTDYAAGGFYDTNAALTLYAKWSINTYTVTYNANGATAGTAPTDATVYNHGSTVTVLGAGTLSRPPYTFGGWNTQPGGGGTNYNPNATFAITSNVTLYAVWNPGTILIHEPFADANSSLSGNTPGSGLTGFWTAGAGATVSAGSLAYSSLPVSGNKAGVTTGNNASAALGTALSNSGLLANGTTLWFSYVVNVHANSSNSDQTGFALGTSAMSATTGLPMSASEQGIGVSITRGTRLKAASWNATLTESGPNTAGLSVNTPTLIVGKIVWGADNAAGETITLYKPAADLLLPATAHTAYTTPALNQTTFDTISFARVGDANETDTYDEIRFGATYESVVGSVGASQVSYFEISPITSTPLVGEALTGVTITARDASNQTVTSFTGTVNFGGTAGITGTSDAFVNGMVVNPNITPMTAGNGLSFTVDDGAGRTGTTSLTVLSRYSGWAGNPFANEFLDTATTSNPDGDRFTNLQEFAFGTDPTDAGQSSLGFVEGGAFLQGGAPVTVKNGATRLAVFARRKDHLLSGLTYSVQFSADMNVWTTSATTPSLRTDAADTADHEAVSVPYPATVPVSGGGAEQAPKFFRVGVTGN